MYILKDTQRRSTCTLSDSKQTTKFQWWSTNKNRK